jgi:hypothetical protein
LVTPIGATRLPQQQLDTPFAYSGNDYADIPASAQTLTIPAGTLVIVWSLSAYSIAQIPIGSARIRPGIDAAFPSRGNREELGPQREWASGSWSTVTDGGTVAIRLQVGEVRGNEFQMDSNDSLNWTVVVYPLSGNGVPAFSGVGLVLLAMVLVGAGCVVMRRRVALDNSVNRRNNRV